LLNAPVFILVGNISSRGKAKETGMERQTSVALSQPPILLLATDRGQKDGLRTVCMCFASPGLGMHGKKWCEMKEMPPDGGFF
jgi:hypothetical protein